MSKIYKNQVITLRAKIKGLQIVGSEYQKKISLTTANKRNSLREEKRLLGEETRYHLLAYAFFRGIPYKKVERNCRLKPRADHLMKVIKFHSDYQWIINDRLSCSGWKIETICDWLNADKVQDEQAA